MWRLRLAAALIALPLLTVAARADEPSPTTPDRPDDPPAHQPHPAGPWPGAAYQPSAAVPLPPQPWPAPETGFETGLAVGQALVGGAVPLVAAIVALSNYQPARGLVVPPLRPSGRVGWVSR
jgi:hypothetical protein